MPGLALHILANRSLVVPDQEERHFVLMPLVADFLRRKRPEVTAKTGNRLEQYAYALIIENGYRKRHRFLAPNAAWSMISSASLLFLTGLSSPDLEYARMILEECEA